VSRSMHYLRCAVQRLDTREVRPILESCHRWNQQVCSRGCVYNLHPHRDHSISVATGPGDCPCTTRPRPLSTVGQTQPLGPSRSTNPLPFLCSPAWYVVCHH